jgi:hypothetical protein
MGQWVHTLNFGLLTEHTSNSDKTHTLNRQSTGDDECDGGEIPHLVTVDILIKTTLFGMSCHVVW